MDSHEEAGRAAGLAAVDYAQLEDGLDYVYAFFEQDLEQRVRAGREFIPAGLEDVLGDDSLEDYLWLWFTDPGPRGFRQYLRDGGYSEREVDSAFHYCRSEWGMNTFPHAAWLREDGFATPRFD